MEQRKVRWWAMFVLLAFLSSTFTVHAENTDNKHASEESEGEEVDSSVKARQAADKLVSAKVPVDTIGRIMSDRDFSESISAAKFDKLLAKKELNISPEQKAALRESFKIAGTGRVFQQGLGNALSELQQPQPSPTGGDPKGQPKGQDPGAQAKGDPSKDKAGDLTKQLQDALGLSKNGVPNQNELLSKLAGILDPKNQPKGPEGQGQPGGGSPGGGAPGGGSPGGGSPGGNQGNQAGQALGAIANALKHGGDNKNANNNKSRSNSRGATSDDDKKKEDESKPKVSSSDDSDSSVSSFLNKEKEKAKEKKPEESTDLANLANQNAEESKPLPPPGRQRRVPSGPTSVPKVLPDSGFAGLPGLGGSFGSEPGADTAGFGGAPIQGGPPGGGAVGGGGGFDLASMRLEDNPYFGGGGGSKFNSGNDVYAGTGAASADSGSSSSSSEEPEGDFLPSAETIGKLATAGKVMFLGGIPTTVIPLVSELAGSILTRNVGQIVIGFCKAETTRGNDFCVARRNKPSKKGTVGALSSASPQDS